MSGRKQGNTARGIRRRDNKFVATSGRGAGVRKERIFESHDAAHAWKVEADRAFAAGETIPEPDDLAEGARKQKVARGWTLGSALLGLASIADTNRESTRTQAYNTTRMIMGIEPPRDP